MPAVFPSIIGWRRLFYFREVPPRGAPVADSSATGVAVAAFVAAPFSLTLAAYPFRRAGCTNRQPCILASCSTAVCGRCQRNACGTSCTRMIATATGDWRGPHHPSGPATPCHRSTCHKHQADNTPQRGNRIFGFPHYSTFKKLLSQECYEASS